MADEKLTQKDTVTTIDDTDIFYIVVDVGDTPATKKITGAYMKSIIGAGTGATTSLNNLSAVAINESLISDTDSTDDLGSTAKKWLAAYLDTLVLGEQASAPADVAGDLQFWAKNTTPNRPMATDDAGNDFELLACEIGVACSDETSDLTTGTAKATFRMPYAMTVSGVRASVTTAPVGSTIIVDINESGTSILSTKLTIDDGEKTSETAATPAVISDAALADDAEMTFDIDQVGSTTAGAGLKVWLIGTRA